MQKEIKQTWHFNQSPQEVWEYLTKPELIEQWLMKNDFKPVVGHKFCFMHAGQNKCNYDNTTYCEVLEVSPCTKLSYTWDGSTEDKSRNFNSTVVWTLVTKNKGTELQLQHNGFTVLEDILNHTNGWDNCFKKLEEHINLNNE